MSYRNWIILLELKKMDLTISRKVSLNSDWVSHFDSFDLCKIPTTSDDNNVPKFNREQSCSGIFNGESCFEFDLKVGARRNIFIQTLIDTKSSYLRNYYCCKLILKDAKGKIIRPRLPLQVLLTLTLKLNR